MRRLTTCLAAFALVLAGCGDDDDTTATTGAPADGGAALAQSCTSPDGFTVSYPEGWEAVSDCGQFGPAPLEEPTPDTDDRTGVVSAFIDPVPYDQVSEPTEGDRSRDETTVDGRSAVRIETVVQEGLYPEGTEGVRWLVDVGGDRTLFLDAYDLGHVDDFDRAVEVLDQMAESIRIDEQ